MIGHRCRRDHDFTTSSHTVRKYFTHAKVSIEDIDDTLNQGIDMDSHIVKW